MLFILLKMWLDAAVLFKEYLTTLNPFNEAMFPHVGAGTDAINIITKAQSGGQSIKMEMNDRIK